MTKQIEYLEQLEYSSVQIYSYTPLPNVLFCFNIIINKIEVVSLHKTVHMAIAEIYIVHDKKINEYEVFIHKHDRFRHDFCLNIHRRLYWNVHYCNTYLSHSIVIQSRMVLPKSR